MSKILKYYILVFTCCCFVKSNSQTKCGTDYITTMREHNHKSYKISRKNVNEETKNWILENQKYLNNNIITIPVVVHVVWKTNIQNISDAQIISQIDVLNKDYRRTNIDQINTPTVWQSIAADCQIEFCLASIDPNGQPTNGIVRVQTDQDQFGMNNDIHNSSAGGSDDWPNEDYLNIWVCNLGNGLLGYATPPSSWIGDGDGLVIGYNYFGTIGTVQSPYNKGRTATHEIGHWLNLDHLWGAWGSCGNDNVSDTPKQEEENYSCPGYPTNINACNTNNPDGDMFMNYMDYTNDACMNLFTTGQKTRMIAAINQYRPNMINHSKCENSTYTSEVYNEKNLIKIIDIFGRETKEKYFQNLLYIYDDGSVEKRFIIK